MLISYVVEKSSEVLVYLVFYPPVYHPQASKILNNVVWGDQLILMNFLSHRCTFEWFMYLACPGIDDILFSYVIFSSACPLVL